jgi:hypothetical protein
MIGTLCVLLSTAGASFAKDDGGGVPVHVTVLDSGQAPVATAVIRHPKEADRHRVNAATGEWEASVLYLPDGSELIFEPGMTVQFEISAPGFLTQIVEYDVRKRKNNLQVVLEAIDLESSDRAECAGQLGK